MIKKSKIALFFDTGNGTGSPVWKRIKKSTELTIAMNAETEDTEYIVDDVPSTELSSYKPSINQPLKMIKDEPDFEFFWKMFFNLKTGEEAKVNFLVAFMFEEISDGKYSAWKTRATITFDQMACNDSELTFTVGLGEIEQGTVSVTGTAPDYVPTFTNGVG